MLFEFRGDQLSKARSYADVEEALGRGAVGVGSRIAGGRGALLEPGM